jgi:glycosyltransferase involved in cell wall biosynthesis
LHRLLPFAQTTFACASAILAGSSQTYSDFSVYGDKVFYLPENGLSDVVYQMANLPRPSRANQRLQLIYVGRLVPFKACDLALRASASLLQTGLAHLTIVGDGPDRRALEDLARSLRIDTAVSFMGWLDHDETMTHLRAADVLVFPSIREFGGGVVFEALAVGAVPVVVDFGGPGDIVNSSIGFKVKITNEADVVSQLESALKQLSSDPVLLKRLRDDGMAYAREHLSWDAKARVTTQVLSWTLGRGPKPDLRPPKNLSAARVT